ncbi:MAG: ATP-binding protein [Burkholderiaceae bacterium]|nr:ATP-binding protein [Burkholderiaceae bacterium]
MANSQTDAGRPEHCSERGEYTSHNMFGSRWTTCPTCAEAEHNDREAAIAAARLRERAMHREMLSGLERRFLPATFANFEAVNDDQLRVLNACSEFVKSIAQQKGGGLALIGKPGTGKTHLGSAMVNALIREQDTAAMIYSGREIVRLLRSTWGDRKQPLLGAYDSRDRGYVEVRRPDSEEEMLRMFGETPLLVIDEVGMQFGSDAETVQLFDVIDLRYRLQLPTVILSNLTGGELKKALGDRAYDRIREGSRLLACKWESRRKGGELA